MCTLQRKKRDYGQNRGRVFVDGQPSAYRPKRRVIFGLDGNGRFFLFPSGFPLIPKKRYAAEKYIIDE